MLRKLMPWLQLVRIPNVFTVPGDALAGAAVATTWAGATAEFGSWPGPKVWLAAAAGCLIYLGGMAFNDWFDRHEDARERPHRPIPSGDVPSGAAVATGFLLHLGGVAAAAAASLEAAAVATLLVLATFFYNGVAKESALGPWAMGACRSLDILLGAVAVGWSPLGAANGVAPWIAAGLMLAYIAVLTSAARGEVGGARRGAVVRTAAGFTGVLVGGAVIAWTAEPPFAALAMLPWLFLAGVLARRLSQLAADPSPARVGAVIKAGVIGLLMFDAGIVAATGRLELGAAIAALTVPALWIGKRFYST